MQNAISRRAGPFDPARRFIRISPVRDEVFMEFDLAFGADRVRPKDAHPPVLVQQGLSPSFLTVTLNPARASEGKMKKSCIPALERDLSSPMNKTDDTFGVGIHVRGTGSVTVVASAAPSVS